MLLGVIGTAVQPVSVGLCLQTLYRDMNVGPAAV